MGKQKPPQPGCRLSAPTFLICRPNLPETPWVSTTALLSRDRRLGEWRQIPRTCPTQGSRRGQGLTLIGRVRLLLFAPTHDQDRALRMTEELHGEAARQEQPGPREPTSAGNYQPYVQLLGQPKNLFDGVALPVIRARDDPAHLLGLPHLLVEQN